MNRFIQTAFLTVIFILLPFKNAISADISISAGITGAWYNASRDGEGLFIEVTNSNGNLVFVVTWYTYDQGDQMWLIGTAPFNRGDTKVVVPMQVTSGTSFGDRFNQDEVRKSDWGTLEFSFSSCKSGIMTYQAGSEFGSGSIPITRLTSIDGLLCDQVSNAAYSLLTKRTTVNQSNFYVYKDADSGFNHGFPSGFFANNTNTLEKIHLDAACLDDDASSNGCSLDPSRLDQDRVNVLSVSFDPLLPGEFAGVNIEEPENWGANKRGVGYDLIGSTHLVFDARSPDTAKALFGVGEGVETVSGLDNFRTISKQWATFSIPLNSLVPPPDLSNVHVLFTLVTNDKNAPSGGTILLDNIHFDPLPIKQSTVLSFPISTETFGVLPLQQEVSDRVSIGSDQILRNFTTTYESALVAMALLDRDRPDDRRNAQLILDAFNYALEHDNSGDPLPITPDGSAGLHNAYSSGDIGLFNSQGIGSGQAGEVRLSGFSADFCGPTRFCLVEDGATGGNVSFAMLALMDGYEKLKDTKYLDSVRILGRWIAVNLADNDSSGFGGYFLGYPSEGIVPKTVITGKSIENNADIFVAFTRLAIIENQLGNTSEGALWTARATMAGDFAMSMFDQKTGCFFAGTVPKGTKPGPGIDPNGEERGNETVNVALFLDANTFTTLALAESPRYQNQTDWRRPVQCVVDKFKRSVAAGGKRYSGFSIDEKVIGPDGIAWEFTAQVVSLMRFVDRLYQESTFETDAAFYFDQINQAQRTAPFTDKQGLVASTLQAGHSLSPLEQCLSTPFQCIPERVGLAATAWAIFAARDFNPLSPV